MCSRYVDAEILISELERRRDEIEATMADDSDTDNDELGVMSWTYDECVTIIKEMLASGGNLSDA